MNEEHMASIQNYLNDYIVDRRRGRDRVYYDIETEPGFDLFPETSGETIHEVDEYLPKIDTSKADIEEIFAEVVDLGYELNFSAEEFDDGNIVKISIEINNDKTHEDITYLQTVYHSIARFIDTYKDNTMKINYEIKSTIKVNFYI